MIIVIMIWMLVLKLQNLKIYKAERKIKLASSFKFQVLLFLQRFY